MFDTSEPTAAPNCLNALRNCFSLDYRVVLWKKATAKVVTLPCGGTSRQWETYLGTSQQGGASGFGFFGSGP